MSLRYVPRHGGNEASATNGLLPELDYDNARSDHAEGVVLDGFLLHNAVTCLQQSRRMPVADEGACSDDASVFNSLPDPRPFHACDSPYTPASPTRLESARFLEPNRRRHLCRYQSSQQYRQIRRHRRRRRCIHHHRHRHQVHLGR